MEKSWFLYLPFLCPVFAYDKIILYKMVVVVVIIIKKQGVAKIYIKAFRIMKSKNIFSVRTKKSFKRDLIFPCTSVKHAFYPASTFKIQIQ